MEETNKNRLVRWFLFKQGAKPALIEVINNCKILFIISLGVWVRFPPFVWLFWLLPPF